MQANRQQLMQAKKQHLMQVNRQHLMMQADRQHSMRVDMQHLMLVASGMSLVGKSDLQGGKLARSSQAKDQNSWCDTEDYVQLDGGVLQPGEQQSSTKLTSDLDSGMPVICMSKKTSAVLSAAVAMTRCVTKLCRKCSA
eukprot:scaffold45248_cov17-Tisochrysis_lutea.AAC.1